jgi:DNA-binding beta-propeller fold protein YncE
VIFFSLVTLAATVTAADSPKYPKLNLAATYDVEPSWPQRPAGIEWGHVSGIAVDKQDQVWVFTRATPPVQVYDAGGKFVRAWGEKHIKKAHHLKIDPQGNVWVADIEEHLVMQFTPEGKLLREIGTRGQTGDDERHFNMPTDMAITAAGDVFVSDGYGNNRVVQFGRDGKFIKSLGKLGVKPGDFSIPHAIAVDSKGRLYVADRNNGRVQIFESSGKVLDVWANVMTPWGLWITPQDDIWVCGSSPTNWQRTEEFGVPPPDQLLMKFNPAGRPLDLMILPTGKEGQEKSGELGWVHCIAVDSKGNIYLGDIQGKRAQKFVRRAPDVK